MPDPDARYAPVAEPEGGRSATLPLTPNPAPDAGHPAEPCTTESAGSAIAGPQSEPITSASAELVDSPPLASAAVDPSTDDAALLESMLRIRSHSREERELAHFLVEAMATRGFTAHLDAAGNAVGMRGDPATGPTILLLGHMDTVPGEVPVHRVGERLHGRGAVDAKGPLATFIAATTGFNGPGRVIVVGAVEEEAATSRGARHVLTQHDPDMAIIGEPSNWDRITIGYKGRLLADYSLERPMAHTAGAQQGVCEIAAAFWQAVLGKAAAYNEQRPLGVFERLQASLRRMSSHSDGLIDRAELHLGFRLPTGFDLAAWQETLLRLASDSGAAIRFHAYEEAVRVEKNTPLARAMLAAIRGQGGDARFAVKTGTSDLNVVATGWRCPMLAYGPGDSALDHTPDEHILLPDYHRAILVLRDALHRLTTP